MTEDDIRRIVREEIERARPMTHHRGIPLPTNAPVVSDWPSRPDWSGATVLPSGGTAR